MFIEYLVSSHRKAYFEIQYMSFPVSQTLNECHLREPFMFSATFLSAFIFQMNGLTHTEFPRCKLQYDEKSHMAFTHEYLRINSCFAWLVIYHKRLSYLKCSSVSEDFNFVILLTRCAIYLNWYLNFIRLKSIFLRFYVLTIKFMLLLSRLNNHEGLWDKEVYKYNLNTWNWYDFILN